MQNSEDYKTKRLKRLKESIGELDAGDQEKMLDFLLEMEEDENEKRKKEIGITLLSEYTEEAKYIRDNWGRVTGIKSGYSSIDSMTKGFDPGNLIVLAGRTSQFKTMLALNMAYNMATSGIPVLFVTLENTKAEIAGRIMKISDSEEGYDEASVMISVQIEDELDWRSISPMIESFRDNFSDGGVVFIDHLHYFTRDTQNTAEALGVVTKEFKKAAIKHKLPVVLISHVRRGLTEKENKQLPSIDDLRGSSLIAQDADIVLMVGDGRVIGGEDKGIVVEIQKNRNKGFDPSNNRTYLYRYNDGLKIS